MTYEYGLVYEMTEEEVIAVDWNLQPEGRAWSAGNVRSRYALSPEKIELIEGKIFCSEEERLAMLGLLLENIGVDKAVSLGNPEVWRKAIERLPIKK